VFEPVDLHPVDPDVTRVSFWCRHEGRLSKLLLAVKSCITLHSTHGHICVLDTFVSSNMKSAQCRKVPKVVVALG